jgi:hypothetical protein
VHLICRLGTRVVAQSIGLVKTGPDQVSEPKEVGYLDQRTSADTFTFIRVYESKGARPPWPCMLVSSSSFLGEATGHRFYAHSGGELAHAKARSLGGVPGGALRRGQNFAPLPPAPGSRIRLSTAGPGVSSAALKSQPQSPPPPPKKSASRFQSQCSWCCCRCWRCCCCCCCCCWYGPKKTHGVPGCRGGAPKKKRSGILGLAQTKTRSEEWPARYILQPVHDGGMVCRRGTTPVAASSACHCGARARSGVLVVDEHGVAVCCARMDGALRTCVSWLTRPSMPLPVVPWMRAFEWRWGCMECPALALCVSVRQIARRHMGAYSVREKQGLVPDLQLDDSH